MGGASSDVVLAGVAGVVVLVWSPTVVRSWAVAARRRGGSWILEALLVLQGPGILLASAVQVQTGSGLVLTVQRALTGGALALGLIGVAVAVGRGRECRPHLPLLLSLGLYYLVLIASAQTGLVHTSVPYYYLAAPPMVLAFLLRDDLSYDWFIHAFSWSLRAIIALSLLAIPLLPAVAFNLEETRTIAGIHRLAGITGHPNGLGAVALVGLLLELRRRQKSRVWIALTVIALVLPQSNTSFVAAIVCLAVLIFYAKPAARVVMWMGASVILGLSLFATSQFESALSAIEPERASTLTGRTAIWQAALQGFHLNPILGYGPDLLSEQYRSVYLPGSTAASHAHNQFVQSLGSTGIVGVCSLVLLFAVLIRAGITTAGRTGGLSLALVAFLLLRSITESPLKPAGATFATLLLTGIFMIVGLGRERCRGVRDSDSSRTQVQIDRRSDPLRR